MIAGWSSLAYARACAVALGAALALGCGPRIVREPVFDHELTQVTLRASTEGGQRIDRGFQHPATIAPTRLAQILARVDVRLESAKAGERTPAVATEQLYEVADGLSHALSLADSSQEVVVLSRTRGRRLGIFTVEHLTSFVAYVKDGLLHVHLSHVQWEVPKGPDEKLPEPWTDRVAMKFQVLPTDGMIAMGPQELAVDWKHPIFRGSSVLGISPTGGVRRRTILMESPEVPAEAAPPPPEVIQSLSPEALRRLADLEEARRSGKLSEADYQAQRLQVLRQESGEAP